MASEGVLGMVMDLLTMVRGRTAWDIVWEQVVLCEGSAGVGGPVGEGGEVVAELSEVDGAMGTAAGVVAELAALIAPL